MIRLRVSLDNYYLFISVIEIMNIYQKDLNLLLVFHVLYQELNVTRAALRMNLSQPTLSHKLTKLRNELGDPLFIKAPRGLTATPKAHEFAHQVAHLVQGIERFYEDSQGQDFLQRQERIYIHTTDFMEQRLLPKLLPLVCKAAPNLTLVTRNTAGQLPRDELEKGTCDIAIAGFYDDLPDTFRVQRLFEESFVVLAARDNQWIGPTLNLEAFLQCEHLITTLNGDLNGVVDKKLAELGQTRRIAAGLSSFLAPTYMIAGTNRVLTCLASIANAATALNSGLCTYAPPLDLPKVTVVQTWHERTEADPVRKWLRQLIQQVLAEPMAN